jgi:2-oxoglutarate ferredoxin oxidoreductase subunit alpha
MERLSKKFNTAKTEVPAPEFYQKQDKSKSGIIFYGTSTYAALEALDHLAQAGIELDAMRLLSAPFGQDVDDFIERHDRVYVVEQNRDGQMRSILINELEINPKKLIPVLNYDGMPITAETIRGQIMQRHSL